jgi:hypothetical protein
MDTTLGPVGSRWNPIQDQQPASVAGKTQLFGDLTLSRIPRGLVSLDHATGKLPMWLVGWFYQQYLALDVE